MKLSGEAVVEKDVGIDGRIAGLTAWAGRKVKVVLLPKEV